MYILRSELALLDFWDSIHSEDSPNWPVLGVDLNGVMDMYEGWPGYVKPWPVRDGVFEFLQWVRPHFGTVYCFTATLPIRAAAEWLTVNGLDAYLDFVSNWKLPGIYLDDNAIKFTGDWRQAYLDIMNHKPHWQKG